MSRMITSKTDYSSFLVKSKFDINPNEKKNFPFIFVKEKKRIPKIF